MRSSQLSVYIKSGQLISLRKSADFESSLNSREPLLTHFLSEASSIQKMLDYIRGGGFSAEEKIQYSPLVPYMSAIVLSSKLPAISQSLQEPRALLSLIDSLDPAKLPHKTSVAYLCKVLRSLVSDAFIAQLSSGEFSRSIRWLYSPLERPKVQLLLSIFQNRSKSGGDFRERLFKDFLTSVFKSLRPGAAYTELELGISLLKSLGQSQIAVEFPRTPFYDLYLYSSSSRLTCLASFFKLNILGYLFVSGTLSAVSADQLTKILRFLAELGGFLGENPAAPASPSPACPGTPPRKQSADFKFVPDSPSDKDPNPAASEALTAPQTQLLFLDALSTVLKILRRVLKHNPSAPGLAFGPLLETLARVYKAAPLKSAILKAKIRLVLDRAIAACPPLPLPHFLPGFPAPHLCQALLPPPPAPQPPLSPHHLLQDRRH